MRVFRMIMECATPLHCGGGKDILQDQPVVRDAFGLWRIPGSSIAGAMRNLALAMDEKMTDEMFGKNLGSSCAASLVWCADALVLDYDGVPAMRKKLAGKPVALPDYEFIREHVCLSLDTETAEEGGKFDVEIVPAGARFFLEILCDGWNRQLTRAEEEFFDGLCSLVGAGRLDFGGKTSNGYGSYNVLECQMRDIDISNRDDAAIWLNLPRHSMLDKGQGREINLAQWKDAPAAEKLDGTVEVALDVDGPLLIGGGQYFLPDFDAESEDAKIFAETDMIFALSPYLDYEAKRILWRPVVPGPAMKGVLRHAIYKILLDKNIGESRAKNILRDLFGYIEKDDAEKDKGSCGKLTVRDCALTSGGKYVHTRHVAIDRFTGGSHAGALFSEAPYNGQDLTLPLRMRLRNATGAQAALFMHLLLDLAQGHLSVGGGGNRGNGSIFLRGKNSIGEILAAFSGDLAWNGKRIFEGDADARLNLVKQFASEWEQELEEEATA